MRRHQAVRLRDVRGLARRYRSSLAVAAQFLLHLVDAATTCSKASWLPPEDRCAVSLGCPKVFYLPEHKVIFCTIPKAASSEWRKLLRRVHNGTGYGWCGAGTACLIHRDVPGSPPHVISAQHFHVLREKHGYRSAVFLRDPVERVGSMFTGTEHIGGPKPGDFSFEQFVLSELPRLMTSPHIASVEHFAPQMLGCNFGVPALAPDAPRWDFVGTTGDNHTDTWQRVTGFIQRVFGEDTYRESASRDWGPCFCGSNSASCRNDDPSASFFAPRDNVNHGATNLQTSLTPTLRARIEQLYAEDVSVFQLSKRYRTRFGAMPYTPLGDPAKAA